MDADSVIGARQSREAGREAVIAHARSQLGQEEMEVVAAYLYENRRGVVDGIWAAKWVLECCYEADELENRPRTQPPPGPG